jgi:serine/threonine protein kinase
VADLSRTRARPDGTATAAAYLRDDPRFKDLLKRLNAAGIIVLLYRMTRLQKIWEFRSEESMTPGTKLGRYEIRSKLGEGGMGEVYLAKDTQLDRQVGLKLLLDEVAADRS